MHVYVNHCTGCLLIFTISRDIDLMLADRVFKEYLCDPFLTGVSIGRSWLVYTPNANLSRTSRALGQGRQWICRWFVKQSLKNQSISDNQLSRFSVCVCVCRGGVTSHIFTYTVLVLFCWLVFTCRPVGSSEPESSEESEILTLLYIFFLFCFIFYYVLGIYVRMIWAKFSIIIIIIIIQTWDFYFYKVLCRLCCFGMCAVWIILLMLSSGYHGAFFLQEGNCYSNLHCNLYIHV